MCIACVSNQRKPVGAGQSQETDSEELKVIKEGKDTGARAQALRPGQNNMWILVAITIDRLFLVVYVVLTLILVITLFLHRP